MHTNRSHSFKRVENSLNGDLEFHLSDFVKTPDLFVFIRLFIRGRLPAFNCMEKV